MKSEGINRNQAVFRIFVTEDGPSLVYFKYIKDTLDRESKSVDAESPSKKNKGKTSNPRKIIRK